MTTPKHVPASMASIVACACFVLPSLTFANEPSQLTQLRKSWLQARTRAAQTIDQRYQQRLEGLQSELAKSGKIEEAITVRKEIQNLISDGNACADGKFDPIPKGAEMVAPHRNTWLSTRSKSTQSTLAIYIRELEKLQTHLVKAGELESALVIKQELEKAQRNVAGMPPPREVAFVGKRWRTASGSHFLFNEDGTGTQSNASGRLWPTKWKEGSDGLIVVDAWQDDVEAKLFFRFDKAREGIFGSVLERLDRTVTEVE